MLNWILRVLPPQRILSAPTILSLTDSTWTCSQATPLGLGCEICAVKSTDSVAVLSWRHVSGNNGMEHSEISLSSCGRLPKEVFTFNVPLTRHHLNWMLLLLLLLLLLLQPLLLLLLLQLLLLLLLFFLLLLLFIYCCCCSSDCCYYCCCCYCYCGCCYGCCCYCCCRYCCCCYCYCCR